MTELLFSNVTKRSIIEYMKELNVNYVVTGNHKTYWSLNGQTSQEENDQEEADTLMMRCLKLDSDTVHTNVVNVYSADTDVFFLLLSHSNKLNCSSLFICLVKGWFDIKLLHSVLGDDTSKALLSLHALTGCDSTGKFEGKSKQFWFKRFLTIEQNDSKLKEELVNFQTSMESPEVIESFVCRCYLHRLNKDSLRKLGGAVSLSSA